MLAFVTLLQHRRKAEKAHIVVEVTGDYKEIRALLPRRFPSPYTGILKYIILCRLFINHQTLWGEYYSHCYMYFILYFHRVLIHYQLVVWLQWAHNFLGRCLGVRNTATGHCLDMWWWFWWWLKTVENLIEFLLAMLKGILKKCLC